MNTADRRPVLWIGYFEVETKTGSSGLVAFAVLETAQVANGKIVKTETVSARRSSEE